jgi:hypothetical protein
MAFNIKTTEHLLGNEKKKRRRKEEEENKHRNTQEKKEFIMQIDQRVRHASKEMIECERKQLIAEIVRAEEDVHRIKACSPDEMFVCYVNYWLFKCVSYKLVR